MTESIVTVTDELDIPVKDDFAGDISGSRGITRYTARIGYLCGSSHYTANGLSVATSSKLIYFSLHRSSTIFSNATMQLYVSAPAESESDIIDESRRTYSPFASIVTLSRQTIRIPLPFLLTRRR